MTDEKCKKCGMKSNTKECPQCKMMEMAKGHEGGTQDMSSKYEKEKMM